MASDEHGMPVPSDGSHLPWSDSMGGIRASGGEWVLEDEFLCLDDFDFTIHAANWIIPCREIVRRLSVWYDESGKPGGSVSFNVIEVSRDAASLWAKMQEEAKGGDGG